MMRSTETPNGILVLTLTADRIDAGSAVHFKDDFKEATSSDAQKIVMDLSAVSFMDSSGLGAVIAALKSVKGRSFELCGLGAAVEKVFKLTRMDKVFVIHPSIELALSNSGPEGADAA